MVATRGEVEIMSMAMVWLTLGSFGLLLICLVIAVLLVAVWSQEL